MKDRLLITCAAVLLLLFVLPGAVAAGTWTLSNRYTDYQLENANAPGGEAVAEGSYVRSGVEGAVSTLEVPGAGISLLFRHGWTTPPGELVAGSEVTTRLTAADQGSRVPAQQPGYSTSAEGSTAFSVAVIDDGGSLDQATSLTIDRLDDLVTGTDVDEGVTATPGGGPVTRDVTWRVPEGKEGSHLVVVAGGTASAVARASVGGGSYITAQPAVTGTNIWLYRYTGSTGGGPIDWTLVIGALAVAGVIGGAAFVAVSKRGGKPTKTTPPPVGVPQKTKPDEKKQQEEVRYILQMSTDTVRVGAGTPAEVRIAAWKQAGSSPPVPAPEATIWLVLPPSVPELTVVPMRGSGSITPRLSVTKPPSAKTATVAVHASAGTQEFVATLVVEFDDDARIVFY
jgi:hypothetical protein